LTGLLDNIRKKVIQKSKIDIDRPSIIDFRLLSKQAITINKGEKAIKEFTKHTTKTEGLNSLIDILGVKKEVNNLKRGIFQNDKAVAPVVKSKDIIKELIKTLSTFILAIRVALSIIAQAYTIYK